MLRAAAAGRRELIVDDRELRRQGPSYTIDTLQSLHRDLPESSLCLLLGDDAFSAFASWRDPTGILAIANIAVLQRPGVVVETPPQLEELLGGRRRSRIDPQRTGQVVFCAVTQLDIASSDIRRRIREGRSVDFLIPAGVLDLIERHRLYRKLPTHRGSIFPVRRISLPARVAPRTVRQAKPGHLVYHRASSSIRTTACR